jgi:hypothetical protein
LGPFPSLPSFSFSLSQVYTIVDRRTPMEKERLREATARGYYVGAYQRGKRNTQMHQDLNEVNSIFLREAKPSVI